METMEEAPLEECEVMAGKMESNAVMAMVAAMKKREWWEADE